MKVDANPAGTTAAIDQLTPLMEVMMSVLEKKDTAHIALLACSLANAAFLPDVVPAMETLFGVNFMASTNVTGNAAQGGDWELETEGSFSASEVYCDAVQLKKYRQTMRGYGHLR